MRTIDNPYLTMDLQRVEQDAKLGVALAKEGLRTRAPEVADTLFGKVVEPTRPPDHAKRIVAAVGHYIGRASR